MPSTFTMIEPVAVASRYAAAAGVVRSADIELDVAGLPNISALLMCGEFERVRTLLTHVAPSPALPLVAAWYHAWSGDLTTLIGSFDAVRDSVPLVADSADLTLQQLTWTWLERAATDVGDPVLAADLVRRARSAGAGGPLPHQGAAAVIDDVVHGMLGVEPDAHRGRLRLRPRLDDHDAILASEIRFADGAVTLSARRAGDITTYTVEQDAGAVPYTALLEPVVAGSLAAEVDGSPAKLDLRPHQDAFIVPVQLVLDERRTLALHMS